MVSKRDWFVAAMFRMTDSTSVIPSYLDSHRMLRLWLRREWSNSLQVRSTSSFSKLHCLVGRGKVQEASQVLSTIHQRVGYSGDERNIH